MHFSSFNERWSCRRHFRSTSGIRSTSSSPWSKRSLINPSLRLSLLPKRLAVCKQTFALRKSKLLINCGDMQHVRILLWGYLIQIWAFLCNRGYSLNSYSRMYNVLFRSSDGIYTGATGATSRCYARREQRESFSIYGSLLVKYVRENNNVVPFVFELRTFSTVIRLRVRNLILILLLWNELWSLPVTFL